MHSHDDPHDTITLRSVKSDLQQRAGRAAAGYACEHPPLLKAAVHAAIHNGVELLAVILLAEAARGAVSAPHDQRVG
jgi:hypothetical protein